jgi:hypothetical protein
MNLFVSVSTIVFSTLDLGQCRCRRIDWNGGHCHEARRFQQSPFQSCAIHVAFIRRFIVVVAVTHGNFEQGSRRISRRCWIVPWRSGSLLSQECLGCSGRRRQCARRRTTIGRNQDLVTTHNVILACCQRLCPANRILGRCWRIYFRCLVCLCHGELCSTSAFVVKNEVSSSHAKGSGHMHESKIPV